MARAHRNLPRRRKAMRRLQIEPLEDRLLLALTSSINGRILTVTGDNSADLDAALRLKVGDATTLVVEDLTGTVATAEFALADFDEILVEGREGDDQFLIDDSNGTITDVKPTTLSGGAGTGRDTLFGGAGGETLLGGDGIDELHGGAGNDLLQGEDGVDHLFGDDGNDTLEGGPGNDTSLHGGAGDDLVQGGDGNDRGVRGDYGNDTIDGGAGDDRYEFAGSAAAERLALDWDSGTGQLVGTVRLLSDNSLVSTDHVTNIVSVWVASAGGPDARTPTPNTPGNLIDFTMFSAADVAAAGIYSVPTACEGEGIAPGSGRDNVCLEINGGYGDDTFLGGSGDEWFTGNGGGDVAYMGSGDDTAQGGVGNDYIEGGDGDDALSDNLEWIGSACKCDLNATEFDDTLIGGAGNDSLSGGPGADLIRAGGGNDVVVGGHLFSNRPAGEVRPDGNDTLDGGPGNDRMEGDFGDDLLRGGEGDDTLAGGMRLSPRIAGGAVPDEDGNDTLIGGGGADTLVGGPGADELRGGAGNDELVGGIRDNPRSYINIDLGDNLHGDAGDDVMQGDDGDDSLEGGPGDDTSDGGAGSDQWTINGTDVNEFLDVVWDGANSRLLTRRRLSDGGVPVETEAAVAVERLRLHGQGGSDELDASLLSASDLADAGLTSTTLHGGPGDDTLRGSLVDDVLGAGPGNDLLLGGAGVDVAVASGTAADEWIDVDWDGTAAQLVVSHRLSDGGVPVETDVAEDVEGLVLDGGDGADHVDASALSAGDRTAAGLGVVTLAGGAGDDTVLGGEGEDHWLFRGGGLDECYDVDWDSSGGRLVGNRRLSCGGVADETDVASDVEVLVVKAGGGDDVVDLTLLSIADLSSAGLQFTTVAGGGGDDTLLGSEGPDKLSGARGDDSLEGGSGDDSLQGAVGNDTLIGGAGTDLVVSKLTGVDEWFDVDWDTVASWLVLNRRLSDAGVPVETDAASEVEGMWVLAYSGADVVDASLLSAADWSASGLGSITLQGGAGDDTVVGSAGNDVLLGMAGDDSLIGGDGDDTLDGGVGSDTLSGGAGLNSCQNGEVNFDCGGQGFSLQTAAQQPLHLEHSFAIDGRHSSFDSDAPQTASFGSPSPTVAAPASAAAVTKPSTGRRLFRAVVGRRSFAESVDLVFDAWPIEQELLDAFVASPYK